METLYSPYLSSYTASWEPVALDEAVLVVQERWAEVQVVRERSIVDSTLPVAPVTTTDVQITIAVVVEAPADETKGAKGCKTKERGTKKPPRLRWIFRQNKLSTLIL